MAKLLLVDTSPYIFRAYYSVPDSMRGADGEPVNAIYGFANFLCQMMQQAKPDYVALAFDDKLSSSFRNEFYPAYKQNREKPPAELVAQFPHCFALAKAMGFKTFIDPQYEADDLIGTILFKLRMNNHETWIVSSDKDLTQLIRNTDIFWDFARNKRLDLRGIKAQFGVEAHQIVDYLGLMGDAVDNIPGVPGVGPKTAAALIAAFDTMENVYENLDNVKELTFRGAKKMAEKLALHREMAFLSQKLARIETNIPIDISLDQLVFSKPDQGALETLFDQFKFGNTIKSRVAALY